MDPKDYIELVKMLQRFVTPKTMGSCADLLYELRNARLDLQKVIDEVSKKESSIKEHIINTLPKSDTGAAGQLARVTVKTAPVPQVKDWDVLYKYIKKTGSFDLLHRRLSSKAVEDRWENGKDVPGVEEFMVTSVTLNKL